MTKEEFAQLLSGKAYYYEQLATIRADAKHHGLIVVYNLFDGIVLCGVIDESLGADGDLDSYEDVCFMLHKCEILPPWTTVLDDRYSMEEAERWISDFKKAHPITLKWSDKCYYWRFETDLPHAKFTLKDFEGLPRGDGIVIDAKDLQ